MLETNDGEFGGMKNASQGVEFGDYIYFSSCDNCDGGSDDGDLGQELWRTDGTVNGTSLFIEINPSFHYSATEIEIFFFISALIILLTVNI